MTREVTEAIEESLALDGSRNVIYAHGQENVDEQVTAAAGDECSGCWWEQDSNLRGVLVNQTKFQCKEGLR